ncbi:MAG: hypothetical protein ACR2HR_13980 [Euzebya sp.]
MPGWHGEAPGRRLGVTVIVASLAAVILGVQLLPLLLPESVPIETSVEGPRVTCQQDLPAQSPIEVVSTVVLSCPELFDGRQVSLLGETIGDLFNGPGDRNWVLVNDDVYAQIGPLDSHHQRLGTNSGLAVLLPSGQQPQWLGGPGTRGDLVLVTGQFQFASSADQGGPAIIAESVVTQRIGGTAQRPVPTRLRLVVPFAVAITVALLIAVRRRNARAYG